MLAKSVLTLALAALSAASPVGKKHGPGCPPGGSQHPPVLPENGGPRELEGPAEGQQLTHIILGVGIQNYTCESEGATAGATGAIAMLYDITALYPKQSKHSLSLEEFNALASDTLNAGNIPLNFDDSLPDRVPGAHPGASATNPFTADQPLNVNGRDIPFAGHHFFNSGGVPQFTLTDGTNVLAAKVDAVDAPAGANPGPDGTGAVAWLYLGANEGSTGATRVYRVHTAGGNSHGCGSAGSDSTLYTTTYWFYN